MADRHLENFPVGNQNWLFSPRSQVTSSRDRGNLKKKKTGISGENHDVFITLTKWFLVQGSTQHCQSKTESWYQGGKEETSAELERDLNSKSTEDMRQEIQNITMLLDELNTF